MNYKFLIMKKALVSIIPFADKLRKIKRNLFGCKPNTSQIELTIHNYERMKLLLERSGVSLSGSTILEIGSGWFPTIPILLARDGAKKVFMSDLNVHMDDTTFCATVAYLKNRFKNDQYIQNVMGISSLPIEYLAPFDISVLADMSLDLVMSHTVLEHIPKNDIYNLLSSIRHKMSNKGIMIHMVDHSDHFEHYDTSISRINFLTWGEEKHVLINFLIKDGENRMRHHEYHKIFMDAGFYLLYQEADIHEKTLENIKTLDLVYPYSKMLHEELAVLTSIYVLRPA